MDFDFSQLYWRLQATAPGAVNDPSELDQNWQYQDISLPNTVANIIDNSRNDVESSNPISIDTIDQYDWWFQAEIGSRLVRDGSIREFTCHGLAGIGEVWLNQTCLGEFNNMFVEFDWSLEQPLNEGDQLYFCFRSINQKITNKYPRPRWKTRLVSQQNLRWIRTSLLGRIPGWTPPVIPIGPYRAISAVNPNQLSHIYLHCQIKNNKGYVELNTQIHTTEIVAAELIIGDTSFPCDVSHLNDKTLVTAHGEINNPIKWWPHTHGEPYLYKPSLKIKTGASEYLVKLSPIGFRHFELSHTDGQVVVKVNNADVFCRGACHTVDNIFTLDLDTNNIRKRLLKLKHAGINMLRVIGTMCYASDEWLAECDRLGIMVWQDFMFANLDYPFDNSQFLESVTREAKQQVSRLAKHCSLVIFCGNSEIQQQVSMLGLPKELAEHTFFTQSLPKICSELAPSTAYLSSTPIGGNMPFHTRNGISHYYGVGAYQRPLNEVRQHQVKFTSECLGFANVPSEATRNSIFKGEQPVVHHPLWKKNTPRDNGAGWDFEDIRDHYFDLMFAQDSRQIRYQDTHRYLIMSELLSGEIMQRMFAEWRSGHSDCRGGLIWFLNDLVPGAGWGIIDSLGTPKACFYFLKRTWQSLQVLITDESINGLDVHVINEHDSQVNIELRTLLLNQEGTLAREQLSPLELSARNSSTFSFEFLLQQFDDVNHCYRFGPQKYKVAVAQLLSQGQLVSEFVYPIGSCQFAKVSAEEIKFQLVNSDNGLIFCLETDRFLYGVTLTLKQAEVDDNYFPLVPGIAKQVSLSITSSEATKLTGYLTAFNLDQAIRVSVQIPEMSESDDG